jgi:excinuclease UvrABC ATPase subunit
MGEKKQKTVKLTHGYATVDHDCSPAVIEALDKLSKIAYNKLSNEKNCPYCDKKGHTEFYNEFTTEVVKDECPACLGTGICEQQLIDDFNNINNEGEQDIFL